MTSLKDWFEHNSVPSFVGQGRVFVGSFEEYVKELEQHMRNEIHSGMTPSQIMQIVLMFLRNGDSK